MVKKINFFYFQNFSKQFKKEFSEILSCFRILGKDNVSSCSTVLSDSIFLKNFKIIILGFLQVVFSLELASFTFDYINFFKAYLNDLFVVATVIKYWKNKNNNIMQYNKLC